MIIRSILFTQGDDVSVANISLGYKLDINNDSLKADARSPWFDNCILLDLKWSNTILISCLPEI